MIPEARLASAAYRHRRLVLFGGLGGCLLAAFGALLSLVLMTAFLVAIITAPVRLVGKLAGEVGCFVSGSCEGQSLSPPALATPGVQAVTMTWLADEEKAVALGCARYTPCVNVSFVQAIMYQESGGNPDAYSSAGALGLMQVEPGHFAGHQSPFDPATNIDVGVAFLDSLDKTLGGNLPLVAAGYNAGPGVPEGWVTDYRTSNWSVLDEEPAVEAFSGGQTWNYVNDVMDYYARFSAPPAPAPGVLGRLG